MLQHKLSLRGWSSLEGMINDFWDNLLEYIDAQRVVPILGAELLVTRVKERDILLHRYIAERIAQQVDIAIPAELPEEDVLNFVVYRFLEDGQRQREDIYPVIQRLMKEAPLFIPEPLRKLARISHFNLFVTTSFDSLLEGALKEERSQSASSMKSLAYSPNNVEDLDRELRLFDGPVVYHLFGRVSAAPDYVITEDDTLEFFSSLQTESKRPEKLFDELKRNHLLIIGGSFPDWLARFFIRIAKGNRLSMKRELEIVADRRASTDKSLVLFLERFSYRTKIFNGGGAVEFVNELSERYQKRHPLGETPAALPAAATAASPQDCAIFLSYARQDAAAAEKIRDALVEIGWDVWFDKDKLEGGDYFKRKIEQSIQKCSLFLPVISASTRERGEGYFRFEWQKAADRAEFIHHSLRFIVPLAIDDTPASDDATVPPKFLALTWRRLPGGRPTSEFTEEMKRLLREQRKRQRGFP